MENLIYCLNAIIPVCALVVLGFFMHKTSLMDDAFAAKLNMFAFRTAIPVQLFKGIYTLDFAKILNLKAIAFCVGATLASILIAFLVSFPMRGQPARAEFMQCSYRGNQAIVGLSILQNMYGDTSAMSVILIGSVLLYNFSAVFLLTVMAPGSSGKLNRASVAKAAKGVMKNPLIIGILLGLFWSFLRIPHPVILESTVSMYANTAVPLGLITMGACIDPKKIGGCWKPMLAASSLKLLIFPLLFLPLAVYLGYRESMLVGMLIMLGSCSPVSAYPMARSMGHDGVLTASITMFTTIANAFTLTAWLYILKSAALI